MKLGERFISSFILRAWPAVRSALSCTDVGGSACFRYRRDHGMVMEARRSVI